MDQFVWQAHLYGGGGQSQIVLEYIIALNPWGIQASDDPQVAGSM